MESTIRELAERQHGVIGRGQILDLGITPAEVQHRIATGLLVRESPQVLRIGGAPSHSGTTAMAAVLDSPATAYLSHRSAAAWWGIPGFDLIEPVHTTIPRQGVRRRTRLGVIHYHADLPREHLTSLRGVPITSPALTLFLLAGAEHPGRVERALDNAWSMRLVSFAELHRLLGRLARRGRNGIRVMRILLAVRGPDYVPPQSGLEARVSRLARDVDVVLRRQVDVGGTGWVGRVDFQLEQSSRLIEVLSDRYHGSPLDRARDEQRFSELRRAGFEVLVVWEHEIWHEPEEVRDRILSFSRGMTNPELDIGAPKQERGSI